MNNLQESPAVLVAPLDWGLGHATRCVPVVRELLRQGARVMLAASGAGKALLQQEFPALPVLHLPGYQIQYASSGWGLAPKMVAQIPKLLSAIRQEQLWLQKRMAQEKIDAVISDNRYGLHHPAVRSVFLTHQLRIKAPFKIAEDILQQLNYRYINRFSECWVPDEEGENSLAGGLSHPHHKPAVPLHYIGPLSRFGNSAAPAAGKYLLFLLSGPEPQRTLLEKRLVADLETYTEPVVVVRGLPGATALLPLGKNVTVYNHLPAAQLELVMRDASVVIGRSGYSTVMDLARLQKRSILIPTPGQTEQEYLAGHLMKKNVAFYVTQQKFRLNAALDLSSRFLYKPFETQNETALQRAVNRLLSSLQQAKT